MADPVTLNLASTAVSLVSGTIGLLKEAREAAKRSDDHDLKDKLNEVFDSVLELKEVIGILRDENAELRKRLETRANIKWDGVRQFYFADGDPHPFCPACMDSAGKQVRLHGEYGQGSREPWKYICMVCKSNYILVD